jgi:hypothetical protein
MAIVFQSPACAADPAAAGTHALVVGIGAYPFLAGGTEEGKGAHFVKMQQLTSSPASARAVRDWLLAQGDYANIANAGLRNDVAPLASVDVLIADEGEPDIPTAARLVEALEAWVARCNTNADNVAFLYVCGHGLQLQDLVLLAADFGRKGVPNAWKYAISLDSIRLGMRKCDARSQFMFFDCCRNYAVSVNAGAERGVQFFDKFLDEPDKRGYVALYSTLEGEYAYGKADQPSYFTRALLHGLLGFASERKSGGWRVTNKMLSKALQDLMRFDVKGATANRQFVGGDSPGDAVLHMLTTPPKVRTLVQCAPDSYLGNVTFRLQRGAVDIQHSGDQGPFYRDVDPGEWLIGMRHNQGAVPDQTDDPVVTPPSFDKTFVIG